MNEMDWALFGMDYLRKARRSGEEELKDIMEEFRSYQGVRHELWFSRTKNIFQTLYHITDEFPSDGKIPGERFSSPARFALGLDEYELFLDGMLKDLNDLGQQYREELELDGPPWLVRTVLGSVLHFVEAVRYVKGQRPTASPSEGPTDEITLLVRLAERFHESVLALKKHPHGGATMNIANEWDCQYLFHSILKAYFRDVRLEEWNPSVAGSTARCEFFLKDICAMIELKFARVPEDQKRFKTELLSDFADYGANAGVDHLVVLVYDPEHKLPAAVQLQTDLSGPHKELKDVRVVVSPPRAL